MVIGLVLILFSALIYGLTLQLPDSPSPGGLTPAAFPRALSIIIGCLSAFLIIKGGLGKDDRKAGPTVGPLFGKMIVFFSCDNELHMAHATDRIWGFHVFFFNDIRPVNNAPEICRGLSERACIRLLCHDFRVCNFWYFFKGPPY